MWILAHDDPPGTLDPVLRPEAEALRVLYGGVDKIIEVAGHVEGGVAGHAQREG